MTAPSLPRLTFYTRTGCHLCADAEALLARLTRELGLGAEVTVVDLAEAPEYEAAYGWRVPVIAAAGGIELEAPIRESDLRRLLLKLAVGPGATP